MMKPRVTLLALSHGVRGLPEELVFRVAQYAQLRDLLDYLQIAPSSSSVPEIAEAWGDASDHPVILREQRIKPARMMMSLRRAKRDRRVLEAHRAKRINPHSRVYLFDGRFSRSSETSSGFFEVRGSDEEGRVKRLTSLFDLPPTIVRMPGPRKIVRAATDVTLSHARVVFLEKNQEDFIYSSTGMLVEHESMEKRLRPIEERVRSAVSSLFGERLAKVYMRIMRDDMVRVKMTDEQMRDASKGSYVDVWITEVVATLSDMGWAVRLRGEVLRCHFFSLFDDFSFNSDSD